MSTRILNINSGSDGDGRKWPKHHYDRNDEYFLERIAAEWVKDLEGGAQPGLTYRLDRMPTGYAGFQRNRPDSKHVDRYIYGHPNGQFRSLVEFYPHFKHLMDVGGSAGCGCIKCAGNAKKAKNLPERRSKYFVQPHNGSTGASSENLISPMRPTRSLEKGRWTSDDDELPKRREVDFEGTPDIYEKLIKHLKEVGPEGAVGEAIEERMSPDWRVANSHLTESLRNMSNLPGYAPRIGELVMFVRRLGDGERLAWDKASSTFRQVDLDTKTWRDRPRWEAGVVTQMPEEELTERDLVTDEDKEQSIIYSGFKIEPLSEPGSQSKAYTKQQKHVPLHAIRPLSLWQDCLCGIPEAEWHPTVKHTLTVSSSVCVVDRYRFKGTWPNASVFCHGMYLGSELLTVGDTVRLLPREEEQPSGAVTEVMTITSIRLPFVNLDFEEDDLAPTAPALPYQTAVHVSGKVYTSDPARSFNGVSKTPIHPESGALPSSVVASGPWYHYMDPAKPTARIEVPFSRILGRCYEHAAVKIWFTSPPNMKTDMQPPAFKAVNASVHDAQESFANVPLLSRGLPAVKDAREYSRKTDTRLTATGQPWFWADTRIEQLDLHEVNGQFVGARDPMRTKDQLSRWQKALKGLDGKKGALEEFEAAHKRQMEQERAALQNTGGMMGTAAVDTGAESGETGNGIDEDEEEQEGESEDADVMEVDNADDVPQSAQREAHGVATAAQQKVTIELTDSEDEDEMVRNQLVGELFRNVRPGGGKG